VEFNDVKRHFVRGSLAAMLRLGVSVPVYLWMTPFLLRWLGAEQYGLWSFGTVVTNFFLVSDFGLKNSLVLHVARNTDAPKSVAKYFRAAALVFTILAVVVCGCAWLFRAALVSAIKVPPALTAEGVFVVTVVALAFALRFLAAPLQGVAEGFQAIDIGNHIQLLWLIGNAAATAVFLPICPTIYTLGWVLLVSNAGLLAAWYAWVTRRYRSVSFRFTPLEPRAILSLLRYGVGFHAATVVILFREPILKLIISRRFGLADVAAFDIALRLTTQLVSVVASPLTGMFAASAMLARRPDDLVVFLRRITLLTAAALLPLCGVMTVVGPDLIRLWLGAGRHDVALLLPYVVAAFCAYYLTEPIYKAIEASGRSGYSAVVQSLSLACCLLVLWTFQAWPPESAIPAALLTGFLTFSVTNVAAFLVWIPGARKVFVRRHLLLAVPTVCWLLGAHWMPQDLYWRFALCLLYIACHLGIAWSLGIVNPSHIISTVRAVLPRQSRSHI